MAKDVVTIQKSLRIVTLNFTTSVEFMEIGDTEVQKYKNK